VIVFLDTNIVIYLVEHPPVFGPRALACCTAHEQAGDTFAVSDLVRLECRVLPVRQGDAQLLAHYDTFFAAMNVQVLPLTTAVCDRATLLRAVHNFKTPDALQLAAAIVHGCDCFLTHDTRLNRCTDIAVEVMP
jgi:predicted nucleic acid-binding protein